MENITLMNNTLNESHYRKLLDFYSVFRTKLDEADIPLPALYGGLAYLYYTRKPCEIADLDFMAPVGHHAKMAEIMENVANTTCKLIPEDGELKLYRDGAKLSIHPEHAGLTVTEYTRDLSPVNIDGQIFSVISLPDLIKFYQAASQDSTSDKQDLYLKRLSDLLESGNM